MDLPKVIAIRDGVKSKDLDAELVRILASEDHGRVVLIANESCQYSFYLQGAYGDLSDKGEFDKKALQNFFNLQNINLLEQINEIKVRVYDPEGRERSKNLKSLIDFHDEEGRVLFD
jgi:hypothetical protein